MPPRIPCSLMTIALAIACSAVCRAQTAGLTRYQNPWSRFEPGAWKLVRVVTDTFDDAGAMTSISETRTVLKEVGPDSVTLAVEVAVRFGGKEFDAATQMVKQGFHGETLTPGLASRELAPGEVAIQGRVIPCRVLQLEYASAAGKTVTKVFYSQAVAPHMLRRETVRTPAGSTAPASETTVEVVTLDAPCRVLDSTHLTATVKTVQKDASGTTATTMSINSMEVPGAVVCNNSTVVDAQGRLIRRSTLELIDYGVTPDDRHGGLFPRLRLGGPLRRFRLGPHRELDREK